MDSAELIKELDELAEMSPPICLWDSPKTVEVGGGEVTVYCKPFEQFQSLVKQAADALREQAVQPSKEGDCEQDQSKAVQPFNEGASHNREQWISVKERLPEMFCGVLVYCPKGKNVYEVYLNARGEWHFFDMSVAGAVLHDEATHWMPLPEPPKGSAQE